MRMFDGSDCCPTCNRHDVIACPPACDLRDENGDAYRWYCPQCGFVWTHYDSFEWVNDQELRDSSIREVVLDWGQQWVAGWVELAETLANQGDRP